MAGSQIRRRPRAAASPFARAAYRPARLAAERRGSRRVRDLRVGAQGRDAQPGAGRARAASNLQKMLHRAGNVDGEGDGCGILVDIPRKIWAEEVRVGGHNPALALDPAFAVAHVFIDRSRGPREGAPRRPRDPRPRRLPDPRRAARGRRLAGARADRPRGGAALLAGGRPAPRRQARERVAFDLMLALEQRARCHVASFSASTCVYKVMGAPRVLGEYYPDLRDERFETIGCFGHNRYSTNTWPSFRRVQPFTVLGHNGEINTIEQLRQEARMLGVPIEPGCSDSQDLNRVVDTLVRVEGLSLAEAMEMVVPPVVEEVRRCPQSCTPSTCTCARRWARSRRGRWR